MSKYNVRVQERSITRTEAIGMVVIVLVILGVILARWGSVIPWGAR